MSKPAVDENIDVVATMEPMLVVGAPPSRFVDAAEPIELTPTPSRPTVASEHEQTPPPEPALDEPPPAVSASPWPADSPRLVVSVWLFGTAVWCMVAALRIGCFHRQLKHARPAPRPLQRRAEAAGKRIGLRRMPVIRVVDGRISPMVWALGHRPVVLLPTKLPDSLGDEEMAMLVAHELAHVRRRDHWVRWLELAATAVYWWFPVAW